MISSFNQIFLLFSQIQEIDITFTNVFVFQYLAEVLENSTLYSICQIVKSTKTNQSFFFSSEQFAQIPTNIFRSLFDFQIFLPNNITIECNHIFASLISNKIFNQIQNHSTLEFIDFSSSIDPEVLLDFFEILEGNVIKINQNNIQEIINTISFLEFNSLSIELFFSNFFHHDKPNDLNLSIESIQKILSFNFIHLGDENQLFRYIMEEIQKNRSYLALIKFLHFGLINYFDFEGLIDVIQFNEIHQDFFDHFKYSLFSNFFLSFQSPSEDIESLLLLSNIISDYSKLQEENHELNLLFELFPINFSNVLIIPFSNQTELYFNNQQKEIVKKFKQIKILFGPSKSLQSTNFFLQKDILFLFIPNSIKSFEKLCFSDCPSLSQITIPDSIESLNDYCFYKCLSLSQVILPSSITTLGIGCFSLCSSLSQIYLPNSITTLGKGCFFLCSSLFDVKIPNSVRYIGEYCFLGSGFDFFFERRVF